MTGAIEDKIEFDPDLSPDGEHNRKVARIRGLSYDPENEFYVDEDGFPSRDEFGQPLG